MMITVCVSVCACARTCLRVCVKEIFGVDPSQPGHSEYYMWPAGLGNGQMK